MNPSAFFIFMQKRARSKHVYIYNKTSLLRTRFCIYFKFFKSKPSALTISTFTFGKRFARSSLNFA